MASMTARRVPLSCSRSRRSWSALPIRPSTSATAQADGDVPDGSRATSRAGSIASCSSARWRGWNPDRGAQLSWFPDEPDFVGSGLPHVGPWDYIQHIPMFWYGPGHIRAQGEVPGAHRDARRRRADAGGAHGVPLRGARRTPMNEALDTGGRRRGLPASEAHRHDGLGRRWHQRPRGARGPLAVPRVADPRGHLVHAGDTWAPRRRAPRRRTRRSAPARGPASRARRSPAADRRPGDDAVGDRPGVLGAARRSPTSTTRRTATGRSSASPARSTSTSG